MAIAHEELLDPTMIEVLEERLVPPAALPGFVPVTDLAWLEGLRERHEMLAARVKEAVKAPRLVRKAHVAEVARWRSAVREAARTGADAPEWHVRLSAEWGAGLIDVAEDAINEIFDGLVEVLRETVQEGASRSEELVAAGVGVVDFSELAFLQWQARVLGGDRPPLPPLWVVGLAKWLPALEGVVRDLQEYPGRRAERRRIEEED